MSTGFTFGTPKTTAPPAFGASTLTFGQPATSQPPSFGFSTSQPQFGSSTPQKPTFGAPTTAPSLSFNLNPTSTAPTAAPLSFGQPSLNFGATSTPSTGFGVSTVSSFGAPATSTPNFALGATAPAPSFGATSAASSLFGAPSATPSSVSFGLGGTSSSFALSTPAPQAASLGLGGVATATSKLGATTATPKEIPPREQFLPNEFVQLVEHFKQTVQEEKTRSSEVARSNFKDFCKVESDLDVLTQQFNQAENQLQVNRNLAEQLKYNSAKGLQTIEMAQRTQDTPASLQYDNTAPLYYFIELADSFEKDMQVLKVKIDNTEKFVRKSKEPNVLTSQDLTTGMRRLHDTFVALAGRMQTVHSQVEAQKEAFLALKKQVSNDGSNPFESGRSETFNSIRSTIKFAPSHLGSGPTPFNTIAMGSNSVNLASQMQQQQQQQQGGFGAPPPTSSLGFGLGNSSFGNSLNSSFNTSSFENKPMMGGGSLFGSNSFQLQKPPTGNKRGKP